MSKEFENMCLRPNCIGCGATTHGLLELKMRKKTRNGYPIYIYLCPVVEHEYLYALGESNARGNLNIVFRLCVNKYTKRYEHDLEEIEERGKEIFIEAGGESYHMIPCMNTNPSWVNTIVQFISEYADGNKEMILI